MPDDIEERFEESRSTPEKASESVVSEVDSGRSDLVSQQKEHTEYLKSGGRSGITDEFGKPLLIDEPLQADGDQARKIMDTLSAVVDSVMDAASDYGQAPPLSRDLLPADSASERQADVAEAIRGDYVDGETRDAVADAVQGDRAPRDLITPGEGPRGGSDGLARDAEAIHEAVDGLGTDEEAIYRALEGKTPEQIAELKRIYKDKYDVELADDLRDDLSGDELERAEKLMQGSKGAEGAAEREPTGDLNDRARERLQEIQNNPEVREARERLDKNLEGRAAIPEEEMKQIREDMEAFEKRAAQANPPLSPEEIAKTYREIGRMLDHPSQQPTTAYERFELAKQVLHKAADPTSITQGDNNSCTAASVETRTYARNPAAAAKLVADVSTTGEFVTADGTRVKVPDSGVKRDDESIEATRSGAKRDHASQIFEVTAVNIKYAKDNASTDPPGRLVYEEVEPVPGRNPPDTGERVMDYSTNPPREVSANSPGLGSEHLPEISRQITGQAERGMVIQNDRHKNGTNDGTIQVDSVDDMRRELQRAKEEGRLPIIVQVHTANEPFWTDSDGGKAGGSGGWHEVTVTDYDPSTGAVSVDNQWDPRVDHTGSRAVSVEQLYQSTLDGNNLPLPPIPGDAGAGADAGRPRTGEQSITPGEGPSSGAAPELIQAAEQIRAATRKDDLIDTGTDEEAIFDALRGKSPQEIEQIRQVYKDRYGVELKDELIDEMSGEELDTALGLALYKNDATPLEKGLGGVAEKVGEFLDKQRQEMEKNQDAQALERIKDDPKIKAEREDLEKLAEQRIKDPKQRIEFLDNMQKFEERAAGLERQYQKEFEARGMSPEDAAREAQKKSHEQIEKTYQNVERLLEKNPGAKVGEADRVLLARQVMEHCANPHSISQGSHGTCNATTVETRTFTKDPAEASRLVADVATTGKYTSNGSPPVTVELDKGSLQKQGEAGTDPRVDGERDYASQIFQVTAVNIRLEKENARTGGDLRYEQHRPVPGKNPPPDDNGERLLDYSKPDPKTGRPPMEVAREIGMNTLEIADISREISPDAGGPVAIDRYNQVDGKVRLLELEFKINDINGGKLPDRSDPEFARKTRELIDGNKDLSAEKKEELKELVNSYERDSELAKGDPVKVVETEEEFRETLAQLKREGKLPAIIAVRTDNEPFWTDSGGGDAAGSGGGHVVTITDYDERTGTVKMQNQWDAASSHEVSAHDLFLATQTTTDSMESLEKEVAENRRNGQVDFSKEYQLLRLKQQDGKLSDAEYDKEIARLVKEQYDRQKAMGGDFKDPAYQAASAQVKLMVRIIEAQDPARAQRIRDEVSKHIEASKGS